MSKFFALVPLAVFLLQGCYSLNPFACRPSRCPEARSGQERLHDLVAALDAYALDHEGAYPERIQAVHPHYLDRWPDCPEWAEARCATWWQYDRSDSLYTVRFTWFGPGVNGCTYQPGQSWRCGGYY